MVVVTATFPRRLDCSPVDCVGPPPRLFAGRPPDHPPHVADPLPPSFNFLFSFIIFLFEGIKITTFDKINLVILFKLNINSFMPNSEN